MKKVILISKSIGKTHLLQSLKEKLMKPRSKESDEEKFSLKHIQEMKKIMGLDGDGTSQSNQKASATKREGGKHIPEWDREWHEKSERKPLEKYPRIDDIDTSAYEIAGVDLFFKKFIEQWREWVKKKSRS